jgi:hypothetical protein
MLLLHPLRRTAVVCVDISFIRTIRGTYSHYVVCSTNDDRSRQDRMNEHLLHCARKQHIQHAREHMDRQFAYIHRCVWYDCNFSFRGKSCGTNSSHVTRHIHDIRSHQCLWNACLQIFQSYEKLAHHVSEEHRVPNDWTMLTKMH